GNDRLVEVEEGRRTPRGHVHSVGNQAWSVGDAGAAFGPQVDLAHRCPHRTVGAGPAVARTGRLPDMNAEPFAQATPPLFVTRDDGLLEELLRLAAAAGVTPEVAADPSIAVRGWMVAPLVLVGADMCDELARMRPPRRHHVLVVGWGAVPDEIFRTALELGAEDLITLPRSDGWLVEAMTDLHDRVPTAARTIGVIGGSGGAGATTFACAVGQLAGRSGPSVVIDTDPVGPGVDRVLGLEGEYGVRWDALQQTTGRLSARTLREALPRRRGVGALTWAAGPQGTLQAFAVREALSAAQRGHDVVVVDLARHGDSLIDEVAARCDRVVVLVIPTVPGLASAARICARMSAGRRLRAIVRGRGVDPAEVAEVTDIPVLAAMADQRGLAEVVDLGAGPLRSTRGPLARAAAVVLAEAAGGSDG
ncbi:MAG: septum site-determining protein Ssd, partial [Nocardioides sp.]